MQSNKLRMAIRATAAVAVVGMAGQAQAFSFSAGDIDAELYGYARLNMSYDIDEDVADNGQSGWFPTGATGNGDGHFGASAIQSRIGLKATNADGVTINVEGDFYSGENGGNFRLRHAYGEYKGVLAGQTWSNYTSFVGVTPTLDFNGIAGTPGYQARAAQLRYTTGGLSVSVEDPKGSLIGASFDPDPTDPDVDAVDTSKDSTPAFTVRYEGSVDALSFATAALVKQNSYDNDITGEDDSDIGFGVFGSASFALTDMFSIQGAVNYTDGANDYLYLSGGSDAYLDGDNLETLSGIGGTLGTSLDLGGGRSVNLAYGMTKLDVDDLAATTIETRENIFLNYMWTPVQNVMMGVEYQFWKQETEGGDSEDANRIMFAAQYNF